MSASCEATPPGQPGSGAGEPRAAPPIDAAAAKTDIAGGSSARLEARTAREATPWTFG